MTTAQNTTSATPALTAAERIRVTPEAARVGFHHPVAITGDVWLDDVHWDSEAAERTRAWTLDVESRLHDVLAHALAAARRSHGAVTHFAIERISSTQSSAVPQPKMLRASIGPDVDGAPLIVIDDPEVTQ